MRFIKFFLAIAVISVVLYLCNQKKTYQPAFTDSGKAVNELINKYQCEKIEFENWEDDDLEDSSLTICLINSKYKFAIEPDKSLGELESVASAIKKVVVHPEKYNSYYVIFVDRRKNFLLESNSHKYGGEIPSSQL